MVQDRPVTRRGFLGGSVALGLASGVHIAPGVATARPDGEDGNDRGDTTGSNPDDYRDLRTAFDSRKRCGDAGTRLDGFEDLSEWDVLDGDLAADTGTVYRGTQSARLTLPEGDEGDEVTVERAFDGLDLSDRDLSLALKLERPRTEQLNVRVYDEDGDSVLMRRRTIGPEYGWFRIDLGVSTEFGSPDLSAVDRIQVSLDEDHGTGIRLWLDDLRATDRGDGGYVLLTFDDTAVSQYERAFPVMREYGFPGFAAINPARVGEDGSLSLEQLRELQSSGWEIGSHTTDHRELPGLEESEIHSQVGGAKQWLVDHGFETGANSFVYPWSGNTPRIRDIVSDYHYLAFTDGSNSHGHRLTGPLTVGRIFAEERQRVETVLPLAATYDQVVVLAYHAIGSGDWIGESGFRDQMQQIATTDGLDVVTPSALLTDLFDSPGPEHLDRQRRPTTADRSTGN